MQPITKGESGSTVQHILVPNLELTHNESLYDSVIKSLGFDHDKPCILIEDQDEVMARLIKQNQLHLYQAFNMLFTMQAMQDCIGNFGTGEGAKQILASNLIPMCRKFF
eukprot:5076735-Ditylum_brightwellii.AAC.3